jgi:hypothetical protein
MTMGVYTTAVLSLLVPGVGRFRVTPKTGTAEGGLRVLAFLRLLTAMTAALVVAVALRAATAFGWVALPSMPSFALAATFAIAAVELAVIVGVLRGLARHRQRRTTYRFPVDLRARGEAAELRIVDLNQHGAGALSADEHRIGDVIVLSIPLPALDGSEQIATVTAEVRSVHAVDDGPTADRALRVGRLPARTRLGLEFRRVSEQATTQIVEYCHVLAPARRAAGLHAEDRRRTHVRRSDRERPVAAPAPVAASEHHRVGPAAPMAPAPSAAPAAPTTAPVSPADSGTGVPSRSPSVPA